MPQLNDKQLMEAYEQINESEYGTKKPETKKEAGAEDAPKTFNPDEEKITTPSENKRQPGAEKAPAKFDGTKETAGKAGTEKRDQGAKEAPKAFESLTDFKQRLRGSLGLPLDDKLNNGNKGIQK